jgi:hypothetical protein
MKKDTVEERLAAIEGNLAQLNALVTRLVIDLVGEDKKKEMETLQKFQSVLADSRPAARFGTSGLGLSPPNLRPKRLR